MTAPVFYAPFRDIRKIKKLGQETTADDPTLLMLVRQVSERIDAIMGIEFLPRKATYTYRYNGVGVLSLYDLALHQPLLELTTLTNANGIAIASGYTLYPRNSTPYGFVRLSQAGATQWAYTIDGNDEISVVGVWGYRQHASEAWVATNTTIDAAIVSTTATTFTVANASAVDANGITPCLSAGMMIQIDDEWMMVMDVTTNTLTVVRGIRGSTAATHLINAPISVYEVEPTIQRATSVWTALVYDRLGESTQVQLDTEGKILVFPKDAPQEVLDILCELDTHTYRYLPT